jgi:hypothetical protein
MNFAPLFRAGACALLAGALAAGCASTGVNVSDQQTAAFVKGKTTRAEVVAALGPPTGETHMADGTRLIMYTYAEAKARAATYIPFVGAFVGGADSHGRTVGLRFDDHDLLLDITTTESSNSTQLGR